jgi:hypothetical protein
MQITRQLASLLILYFESLCVRICSSAVRCRITDSSCACSSSICRECFESVHIYAPRSGTGRHERFFSPLFLVRVPQLFHLAFSESVHNCSRRIGRTIGYQNGLFRAQQNTVRFLCSMTFLRWTVEQTTKGSTDGVLRPMQKALRSLAAGNGAVPSFVSHNATGTSEQGVRWMGL